MHSHSQRIAPATTHFLLLLFAGILLVLSGCGGGSSSVGSPFVEGDPDADAGSNIVVGDPDDIDAGSGIITGDPDFITNLCNSPWVASGSYCSPDGPTVFTTRPTCGDQDQTGIVDACGVALTALDLHDPVVMTMTGLTPNRRHVITIENPSAVDVTGGGYIATSDADGEINKTTIVQNMAELPGSELGDYTVKVNTIPATTESTFTYTVEDRSRVQCADAGGIPQASFLSSDSVYAKVSTNAGSLSDGTYDVYVLNDANLALASGLSLGSTTFSVTVAGGTGLADLGTHTPGAYDVVVDVNGNGVFNQGIDLISRHNRLHPCFAVQGNTGGVHVEQIASDKNGNSREIFDSNANIPAIRDITAAFTPTERSTDQIPSTVRTYLVAHQDTWVGDGSENLNHVDLSDDYKTNPVQNYSNSDAPWIVTPFTNLAALGNTNCYDVVVDTDANGIFNAGSDYVDNVNHLGDNTDCGVRISTSSCTNVSITSHTDGTYLATQTAITLEGVILGSPTTSRVTVTSGSQTNTVDISLGVAGGYSFDLPLFAGSNHITVSGIYADNSTCSRTITIERPANVALFRAQLTWDGSTDMDLHLVKPGGNYHNGGSGSDGTDCNWANCKVGLNGELAPNSVDWGVIGVEEDDPKLDVDCISCGNGIENIWMDYISEDGAYEVYVDAYTLTGTETGDVIVTIYILGTEVGSVNCTPGAAQLDSDSLTEDSCFVGTINWTGGSAGTGTFVPDGTVAGDF